MCPKGKKKSEHITGVPGFVDQPLEKTSPSLAMLDGALQPWSRQSEETPKSYAAFLTYLEMGEARSLTKAYYTHKGRPLPAVPEAATASGQWIQWSSRFDWVSRSKAWDEQQRVRKSQLQQQYRDRIYMDLASELMGLKTRLFEFIDGQRKMSAVQYQALVQAMRWAGIEEPREQEGSLQSTQNNVVVYIPSNGREKK